MPMTHGEDSADLAMTLILGITNIMRFGLMYLSPAGVMRRLIFWRYPYLLRYKFNIIFLFALFDILFWIFIVYLALK